MVGKPQKRHGTEASSADFAHYDQVGKQDYHLAESADDVDAFDDQFQFSTCDLGRYLHGSATDRQAFSQELGEAMESIGFAILEGHGIDEGLFESAEACIEELFTQTTLADKLRFRAARHEAVNEGYFPLMETSDIHPDQVEGWVLGRRAFDLDEHAKFDARELWPHPDFERRLRPLVRSQSQLFLPIMQGILSYLGCDPHHFNASLAKPQLGQRLNYYPPMDAQMLSSGAGRLLGHEDVDLFTLLPAPRVEGLQVLHTNGRWVRLNAPPGTIILNTGDYLQRLSNDRLPSTTHRVSPPSNPEHRGEPRVSFPLAAYLGPQEILRVLPGLGEPKYDPVRVITFHTRTTAKFYGDDYAVERPVD